MVMQPDDERDLGVWDPVPSTDQRPWYAEAPADLDRERAQLEHEIAAARHRAAAAGQRAAAKQSQVRSELRADVEAAQRRVADMERATEAEIERIRSEAGRAASDVLEAARCRADEMLRTAGVPR